MLTLILDSAARTSTAILANGDQIISESSREGKALKELHLSIQRVLKQSSVKIQDINKIGIVQGPGSWTGLHVAISTAKTIAQVYNVPLIPISFIDAFAHSTKRLEGFITALSNSSKGIIFTRSYEVKNNIIIPTTEHQKPSIEELIKYLDKADKPHNLIGDFSQEIRLKIEELGSDKITLEYRNYPSSNAMLNLVNSTPTEDKNIQDMLFLEPLYMQFSGEGPRLFSNRINK